jgi:hypothetical protein
MAKLIDRLTNISRFVTTNSNMLLNDFMTRTLHQNILTLPAMP